MGRVLAIRNETPRAKSLILDVPGWPGHRAGQHVDVRLTAEDGYRAERSYSIASPPEERQVALTVERLEDGEVSHYLTDGLQVGDQLELRGPIGGYFTWQSADGGPLLLVAGGSGIVRCPGCGEALIRLAHGLGRIWVDFSGVQLLELRMPE